MSEGQEDVVSLVESSALEPVVLTGPAAQAVQAAEDELRALFETLGRTEADYLQEKNRLLREVNVTLDKRKQVLDGAARALGLDIDKARWNFDSKTMTLTRITPTN
jgi:hypothetical protein